MDLMPKDLTEEEELKIIETTLKRYDDFRKDLRKLINRHSLEDEPNTSDFVLARYLFECYLSFNEAVNSRDRLNVGRK